MNGHAHYTELTRRLREAGAAGATTPRGTGGFSSDEFARLASHAPAYTTYVDRAGLAEILRRSRRALDGEAREIASRFSRA